MTEEEKAVIRLYAVGRKELRGEAVRIHRKHISDRSSPEQLFMREVDNPSPDLTLRAMYRAQLKANMEVIYG